MARPKTNWIILRVRIPAEWKDVLEDIRKEGAYESISDVVRSILRERIVEAHSKQLQQKKLIKEAVVEALREHKLIPYNSRGRFIHVNNTRAGDLDAL